MVAKAFHYSKFEGWEKVCIIQYCCEVYVALKIIVTYTKTISI